MNVRFAFYKTQSGDVWGKVIAGWTGFFNWVGSGFHKQPPYEHAEIGLKVSDVKACLVQFPALAHPKLTEKLAKTKSDDEYIWYSSASRNADGSNGTRWITEAELLKHPERWDVFDAEAQRPIQDMIDTCNKEVGKPYDWSGIAGFVTIFGQINEKEKWYCSEICNFVYFGKWTKRISPIALYDRIKKFIIALIKIVIS